jgi:hypothetical protein
MDAITKIIYFKVKFALNFSLSGVKGGECPHKNRLKHLADSDFVCIFAAR